MLKITLGCRNLIINEMRLHMRKLTRTAQMNKLTLEEYSNYNAMLNVFSMVIENIFDILIWCNANITISSHRWNWVTAKCLSIHQWCSWFWMITTIYVCWKWSCTKGILCMVNVPLRVCWILEVIILASIMLSQLCMLLTITILYKD